MVIVNAAEESRSLRALDKETGEEIWKAEGDALELCYGTPALVPVNDERTDLVIAVPDEVWGLNPETGKLRWYVETHLTGIISPSVVAGDGAIVYVFGGYKSNGSLAVRAGGNGVVTDTQVLWTSRISSYVPTPIVHEGHIWCVDHRGIFTCMKAADGKVLFRRRLEKTGSINMPFYASPILVGAKLIVPSRISGTFVLAADTRAKQLARNRFESDSSDFNATPAVADGRLYLRSNRFLYCVAAE